VLSTYGDFTAGGLCADRLPANRAVPRSYHLRQLWESATVSCAGRESKGTGRERWWERVPEASASPITYRRLPGGARISASFEGGGSATVRSSSGEFVRHGWDELADSWTDVSELGTIPAMRLTADQLAEVSAAFARFAANISTRFRGQGRPARAPCRFTSTPSPSSTGCHSSGFAPCRTPELLKMA
jgi:hypothetical protein